MAEEAKSQDDIDAYNLYLIKKHNYMKKKEIRYEFNP